MKNLKKTIFWIAIVVLSIQLIPVDKENKSIDKSDNFVEIYNTPHNIQVILKNACYDCHSNETIYPEYAYVAPVSWMVKDHINEGRKYLNFSEWGKYNDDLKKNAVEKSIRTVRDFQMPLPSYINFHPKANLTKTQRQELQTYFKKLDVK